MAVRALGIDARSVGWAYARRDRTVGRTRSCNVAASSDKADDLRCRMAERRRCRHFACHTGCDQLRQDKDFLADLNAAKAEVAAELRAGVKPQRDCGAESVALAMR